MPVLIGLAVVLLGVAGVGMLMGGQESPAASSGNHGAGSTDSTGSAGSKPDSNATQTFRDLEGNLVAMEADSVPAPSVVKAMKADDDTGVRFKAPSVGLNVPLGALSMSNNTITPPGFGSAYLVRNMGVPLTDAARGTVYVAMHSLRGGAVAPGNYLIDIAHQRAKPQPGASLQVGQRTYRVTGTEAILKNQLGATRKVWQDVPGRLVVITCLQRVQGGPSIDNMVIFATLVK